jgi:4-hydroxybenzoyl-CoA reductase subunit alpha
MIAEELGLDPVEMAIKNGLQTGDESAAGFNIVSSGFRECLEKVSARTGWQQKRNVKKRDGDKAYGIGLGCGGFPSGAGFYFNKTTSAHSSVIIRIGEGGGVNVFTGASDIGQGSDSVICQIVAEVLGLALEDIHLTSADTHLTPPDMGTYSSRVTVAAGNAALNAANLVKAQISKVAADALEANSDDFVARDCKIYVKGSPKRFLSFKDAVNLYQKKNNGAPLVAQGAYNSPDPLSPTYSFGAYICEVEVSLKTGAVRIKKFTVAHDCGQPLNPLSVEGQIEGCIGMGIGYAISEQLIFEGGQTLNPSFLGYGIPTADQMPEIRITHVITDDPHGPFGAKETGEGSLDPAAPAIANAIYNATGVRIKDLPITAEKILKGLAGGGKKI